LLIPVERGVGVHLDLDLAARVLLGELLELLCPLPFGVSVATTWLNLLTSGACAVDGPTPARAATANAVELCKIARRCMAFAALRSVRVRAGVAPPVVAP